MVEDTSVEVKSPEGCDDVGVSRSLSISLNVALRAPLVVISLVVPTCGLLVAATTACCVKV